MLAVVNFATLFGVPPDSPWRWILPAAYPVAAIIGVVWSLVLKVWKPRVHAGIGLGVHADTGMSERTAVGI